MPGAIDSKGDIDTGDHYVDVRSLEGSTGTYTLAVTLDAFPDDHADVLDRATSVSVGETVPGAIDVEGDIDYFVFRAEQGSRYQIDVALGTLQHSKATLYDDGSFELAFNDDAGDTTASRITWQAEYTGMHFVSVQGFGADTGTYTLIIAFQ